MSELINTHQTHPQLRWRLLATVSAMALTTYAVPAAAQDENRPAVWIELGAQYEEIAGKNDSFVPPFDAAGRAQGFPSITKIENALGKGFGGEGSLSFQPHGSDWIFMASARYGRTHAPHHVLAQKVLVGPPVEQYRTPGGKHLRNGATSYLATPTLLAYADQKVDNSASHTIVDFQVGRDVGLGLFGRRTQSVFAFGARYVQMNTSSQASSHTLPDAEFQVIPTAVFFAGKYGIQQTHHQSALAVERYSNLHAFGPSLSLTNSTGLLGNIEDGEMSLDWGANIAVLFGRQRTHVEHQTTTKVLNYNNVRTAQTTGGHRTSSHRVTIPNVGGFAALSYRFTNAKLSMGYRADFFFGALDRGLDIRNTVTTGFHGPYATFSVGLGG